MHRREYRISVAMATYNGEKYLKDQIDSIMCQLNDNDEIIISDDGSIDKTLEIIKSYNDKRIKVISGPHRGVKQNFANAIKECTGKFIFLSDQDDIWIKGKVEKVLNKFYETNCTCVVHDCVVFNSETNKNIYESYFKYRNSGRGIIKNIWKNSYIGCCMAFDSNIKDLILPIPNDIEMHDQWIGILSEKKGKSIFIDDKLIRYRRHSGNVSEMKRYPFIKMVKNRLCFIWRLYFET